MKGDEQVNLSVKIVKGIEAVPREDWDKIISNDDLQMKYDYLSILSENLSNNFEYFFAVAYDNEKLVAGVTMLIDKYFDFGNSLFGTYGKINKALHLKYKSLQVISPISEYNKINIYSIYEGFRSYIEKILSKEIEKFAKEQSVKVIIWRDYLSEIKVDKFEQKYTHFFYMPGTVIHLDCNCFDHYLDKLPKKRRHNIKNKIKKCSEDLKVEVIKADTLSELEYLLCYKCYIQTLDKNIMKYDKLSETYFYECSRKLAGMCKMLIARYKGSIVGVAQLLENDEIVINVRMGMEYSISNKLQLYYHMLYANIQYCILNRKKHLFLSQTCYRPKIEVGATLVPLHTYMLFSNPITNFIYKYVAKQNYKRYEELVKADNPVDILKKYEAEKFYNEREI